jgi:hypothetical protein
MAPTIAWALVVLSTSGGSLDVRTGFTTEAECRNQQPPYFITRSMCFRYAPELPGTTLFVFPPAANRIVPVTRFEDQATCMQLAYSFTSGTAYRCEPLAVPPDPCGVS